MRIALPKFLLLTLVATLYVSHLEAQCPNCEITLPPSLPEDTLFLSPVAEGEVGLFYEEDLSFRMPLTTDPVNAINPDVPAGLDIEEITLLSIANVPPGLAWEADESIYIPEDNSDGCMRFCGTPLVPGTYVMDVTVVAKVSIFSQTTSFTIEMIVLPSSSSNAGFSMSNNVACESAIVSFENNIPSNGVPGISYQWDFGNGNSTLNEQPNDQQYTAPGIYEVQYQAIVDTVGYILTNIEILETGCTDFPTFPNFSTAPDLSITVYDPDSNIVFETPNYDNTFPPISASLFLPLTQGNYTIEVIDDDSGINLGDDLCGLVSFNQFVSGVIVSDEFSMQLTIVHPVDTITTVDTVYIFENPAAPIIETSVSPVICNGTVIELMTNYTESLQWYFDDELIVDANQSTLEVSAAGTYRVEYFDENGCQSSSAPFLLEIIPLPELPAFVNSNNLLTLFDQSILPNDFALQWYQDGMLLEGETDFSYCISEFATYTLEVVDLTTGCANRFSSTVPYNSAVDCTTSTEELALFDQALKAFPNPFTSQLQIELLDFPNEAAQLSVVDLLGQNHWTVEIDLSGNWSRSIDLAHLPAGVYFIRLNFGQRQLIQKIVKQ
ncbi:MAG: T9SS type A sorting domain-containing protein [Bacteroidota bacterium]